jgi:hypothetical protein
MVSTPVAALVGGDDERGLRIDDAAPSREFIAALARAGGVGAPLALDARGTASRPPRGMVLATGPAWAPPAPRTPPVCCACFGADRAAGRDDHLRADWLLAERYVCPHDRQLLRDHCPLCRRRLWVDFRLRDGRERAVCRRCGQELAARSPQEGEGELVGALRPLQDRNDPARRARAPQTSRGGFFDALGAARRSGRPAAGVGAVDRSKRMALSD